MQEQAEPLQTSVPDPSGRVLSDADVRAQNRHALLHAVAHCLHFGDSIGRPDLPMTQGAALLATLLREVHRLLEDDRMTGVWPHGDLDLWPPALHGLTGLLRDCAGALAGRWPALTNVPSHTTLATGAQWREMGQYEQDAVRFYKQTFCLAERVHAASRPPA